MDKALEDGLNEVARTADEHFQKMLDDGLMPNEILLAGRAAIAIAAACRQSLDGLSHDRMLLVAQHAHESSLRNVKLAAEALAKTRAERKGGLN